MIQQQDAYPALFSSTSDERQPMITRIGICSSIDFVLHLYTGIGNLSAVNAINAQIGHHACVA